MPIKPRESLPYSFARFTQTLKRFGDPVLRRLRFALKGKSDAEQAFDIREQLNNGSIPVFVYQMGKVASTSIYRSLRKTYPGAVFHAHYFDAFHSDPAIRELHAWYSNGQPQIRLISLIREPVTRNISAFFQNFKRDTGMEIHNCNKTMHELRDTFLLNYPHEIPWVWFDNNIKKNFAIDVYEHPFPEAGHLTINQGNVELLLMRCDLDDSLKSELVGDFVGLNTFKLANSNVSADKEYSQYMDAFKSIKLPRWYLYRLSATKYMKHFYGDEIRKMISEWAEPDSSAA